MPNLPTGIVLVAGFTYIFWSGLSLAWTPFPGESGGRYASFVTIAVLGALLTHILPRRVGASRLYILSGGVAIGWIICLGLSFAPEAEINRAVVERSLITLSLLVPPVCVWLIYRRRDLLAIILVLAALLATIFLKSFVMTAAMLASMTAFAASLVSPDRTRYYLAIGLGMLVLFAPLIPVLLVFPAGIAFGEESAVAQTFSDWFRIIADDPFRLLTGHGFDTIGRAAEAGLIPLNAPHGLLIDTWFELGIIGAIAEACLFTAFIMLSSTMTRPSAAAMQSVIAGLFVIGVFGGNALQMPWLASVALAGLAIAALERGQYKTARPASSDISALKAKPSGFSIFPERFRF